jgi:carbon-monoxide dehydrogenase medium subunit
MKPAPFVYHRPNTRAEVDALLQEHGSKARILAGGQTLVPMLNMRLISPAHLIDINGLKNEPDAPRLDGEAVSFGPLVRHEAVEHSAVVRDHVPLLREATEHVGHAAIRSRGTFVGAISHADPASELPPVLVLLGGEVRARGSRGGRSISSDGFFAGPLEPAIKSDEWIEEVRLPCRANGEGFAIEEFTRRDADFAICGVVVRVRLVDAKISATLAFFSVGDMPTRLSLTPLTTNDLMEDGLESVVHDLVTERLEPPDDIHATGAYRRHLAERLAIRALRRAAISAGAPQ